MIFATVWWRGELHFRLNNFLHFKTKKHRSKRIRIRVQLGFEATVSTKLIWNNESQPCKVRVVTGLVISVVRCRTSPLWLYARTSWRGVWSRFCCLAPTTFRGAKKTGNYHLLPTGVDKETSPSRYWPVDSRFLQSFRPDEWTESQLFTFISYLF